MAKSAKPDPTAAALPQVSADIAADAEVEPPAPNNPEHLPPDQLRLRGVRVHNLKDVNLDLPRGKLTVVTGVSGCGKSSLAFDTIFAEGQRQFIESLSPYARQFLHQLERPDADLIEGLEPTIAIDQSRRGAQPRSTVGTVTEVYDYLRVLMARLGTPHCPGCGAEIRQQSREQIIERIRELPDGTKAMILAPLARGRKGKHADTFEHIRKAGFVRARIDGEVHDMDNLPEIAPRKQHDIDAIVDRVIIRDRPDARVAESIDLALGHGDGVIALCLMWPDEPGAWHDVTYSTQFACPRCPDVSFTEVEPRTFSFNSPYGACPSCQGLGIVKEDEVSGETSREESHEEAACPDCGGGRLCPAALSVTLADKNIHAITQLPIDEALEFFAGLTFSEREAPIAKRAVPDIVSRLQFLDRVGVGYLSLARGASTLSGGEWQRVRLATAIGAGLVGVCYVLDEPSIGLHPDDNDRLIASLGDLREQGNTLIVVEHDEAMIRAADCVVDLGPGAGKHGGQIVALGSPMEIAACKESITGDYLAGRKTIRAPGVERRPVDEQRMITLRGAAGNNLREITVRFPLAAFTCVTGVSGSGKSTLVMDTLCPAVARKLDIGGATPAAHGRLDGADVLERFVEIDQAPLGRSPRSNAATYSGAWDEIRKAFAATKEAKLRGFKSARFSFNNKAGRCETCAGQGQTKIEMKFLPDMYVTCADCGGRRFNRQTLEVRYRGKSAADILTMPIADALAFFVNFPKIHRILETLNDVGLGYLTLGQSSLTLSGGEAQRIKLATELARRGTGHTLYVLDEPTTGLHFDDVRKLLAILHRLVDVGNTVIVIEHHTDVVQSADWIIELGPGGGKAGGRLVSEGEGHEEGEG